MPDPIYIYVLWWQELKVVEPQRIAKVQQTLLLYSTSFLLSIFLTLPVKIQARILFCPSLTHQTLPSGFTA